MASRERATLRSSGTPRETPRREPRKNDENGEERRGDSLREDDAGRPLARFAKIYVPGIPCTNASSARNSWCLRTSCDPRENQPPPSLSALLYARLVAPRTRPRVSPSRSSFAATVTPILARALLSAHLPPVFRNAYIIRPSDFRESRRRRRR